MAALTEFIVCCPIELQVYFAVRGILHALGGVGGGKLQSPRPLKLDIARRVLSLATVKLLAAGVKGQIEAD